MSELLRFCEIDHADFYRRYEKNKRQHNAASRSDYGRQVADQNETRSFHSQRNGFDQKMSGEQYTGLFKKTPSSVCVSTICLRAPPT